MVGAMAAPAGWAGAGLLGGASLGEAGAATAAFLTTNPVGWAILGVAAVGAVGVIGYKLYQNAHDKSKEQTKDEAQDQVCTTCKPKNPCDHLKKGNGSGDYRGGGHGNPDQNTGTSSPRGDELDSHHMPAKQAYKGSGLDPADGPAIQMDPADHAQTADYGGRGQAARDAQKELIDNGQFDEAFDKSAENVRDIAKKGGNPEKYDEAIKEAKAYKDCLKANGLLPGG